MGAADESVEAFLAAAPLRDLYEVLATSPDADGNALKKAYRKRCLAFHPDKNPHARAQDAFLLVSAAYETLSDATRRSLYDTERLTVRRRPQSARQRPRSRSSKVDELRRATRQRSQQFRAEREKRQRAAEAARTEAAKRAAERDAAALRQRTDARRRAASAA